MPRAAELLLLLAACQEKEGGPVAPDDSASARWTGEVEVRVVDPDGAPVADAAAQLGGASEEDWAWTDAEGRATVTVTDDGVTDRWITAGKFGYTSGGVDLDELAGPDGVLAITLDPLPEEDNPAYAYQQAGDGMSPDASYCGHCHPTLGDDWAGSDHARSASNPRTWDLYTGRASGATDCASLGGAEADGQEPGVEGGVADYCYVDEGVLGWLNDCAIEDGRACDHPDRRGALTHFGSCGDCHSPAIDGAVGGDVDLADATGVGFEGVTCDFCHKVRAVEPGGAPGLDGAITLVRPSDPTKMVGQQFDPITTGPYPDVIVGIMQGSYTPQMLEAAWCSACHQYDQPALRADQALDATRWPDGLPIFETWGEFVASYGEDTSYGCRNCHMETVYEESSTYDITALGLSPSPNQGWWRAEGEVRHHDFPGAESLVGPSLRLALEEVDGELVATVTVINDAAGHAVPTGEPMKQLIVLVSATVDGATVLPTGGAVVPDVGGALAAGEVGADVAVDGDRIRFVGASLTDEGPLVVRFARPTGAWVDYAGPGTDAFSDETLEAEDKGIEELEYLGELAVSSVSGDEIVLAGAPPELLDGDRVFLDTTEDHAGAPGWLFGKVLVDADGARGVPHYRAVDVASDNRIAADDRVSTAHRFALPTGELVVTATLLRRTHAMTVARPYGWDPEDAVVSTAEASW